MPEILPKKTSTLAFEKYTASKPVASSQAQAWSNLLVRVYQEPDVAHTEHPGVPNPLIVVQQAGKNLFLQRKLLGKESQTHVGRGSVWFVPPEQYSEWRWKNLSNEKIVTVHLHLDQGVLRQAAEDASEKDAASLRLLDRFPVQDPLIEQVALALKQELESGSVHGKLYAQTASQLLSVHLLRHHCTTGYTIKEYQSQLPAYRLGKVVEYMHEHLDEDISLEALAHLAEMSQYHFARLFKKTTGKSPYQYLIGLRLEKAQRLLRETPMQILHIAFEVGYHSTSQFFEAFQRYTGTTPTQYRSQS